MVVRVETVVITDVIQTDVRMKGPSTRGISGGVLDRRQESVFGALKFGYICTVVLWYNVNN